MSRGMVVKPHFIRVVFTNAGESLVFEQYENGKLARRATIDLETCGAEEVTERLAEVLKHRREHAARLERYLALAVVK